MFADPDVGDIDVDVERVVVGWGGIDEGCYGGAAARAGYVFAVLLQVA